MKIDNFELVEWLENAVENIQTGRRGFPSAFDIAIEQIENAIKVLSGKELDEDR